MNYVFIFCSVFLKVTENERYPTSCLLTTDFLFSILVFLFLFLYSDLLILCILVLQIHLSVLLCETEMRDQYAKLFWFSMLRCKLYFFLMMLNIWLHRKVVLVICCFYKKVVWKWCHPRYLKRHFLPFEVFEILWWTIFSWTGICLLQNQFISWRSD